MGFLSRLLIPRGVRRVAHPGRAVKRAVTPKSVKRARRALHPSTMRSTGCSDLSPHLFGPVEHLEHPSGIMETVPSIIAVQTPLSVARIGNVLFNE